MQIVNLKTFLELPPGTVYAKYQPSFFGNLAIKGETISHGIDFWTVTIVDALDCNDFSKFINLLDRSEKEGVHIAMDFDTMQRDGLFEKEQLFAVWHVEDLKQLISILQIAVDNFIPV